MDTDMVITVKEKREIQEKSNGGGGWENIIQIRLQNSCYHKLTGIV